MEEEDYYVAQAWEKHIIREGVSSPSLDLRHISLQVCHSPWILFLTWNAYALDPVRAMSWYWLITHGYVAKWNSAWGLHGATWFVLEPLDYEGNFLENDGKPHAQLNIQKADHLFVSKRNRNKRSRTNVSTLFQNRSKSKWFSPSKAWAYLLIYLCTYFTSKEMAVLAVSRVHVGSHHLRSICCHSRVITAEWEIAMLAIPAGKTKNKNQNTCW